MSFAKKSLGQNFLKSTEVRDRILEAAGNISGKNILEIGPGLGFLTTKLLSSGVDLTAVELDERAVEILNRDFGQKENFRLIQGSILDQDLDKIFGNKNYAVIANIPYHITSPIIRKLLAETRNRPEFLILMVQKEVGEKICLERKWKHSILSLSVAVFAEAEYLFTVGRENFSPSPKVDSAIIKLTARENPLVSSELEKDFFTVINAGFHEKRKKIGNGLKRFFGIDPQILLGDIDPNLRAERLSIEEWIQITENFRKINRSY